MSSLAAPIAATDGPAHAVPHFLSSSLGPDGPTEPPVSRRERIARLLAEQPTAVAGQAGALMVVVSLLWTEVPHLQLLLWTSALVVGAAARGAVWYRSRGSPAPEKYLYSLRVVTTLGALTWGAGVGILAPFLPAEYLALLLLVLCGLIAAGSGTMAADLVSFRLFAAGMLIPIPVYLLMHGADRFHVAAASLTVLYGAFILQLHRRNFTGVVERIRVLAQLKQSHHDRDEGRAFLDAMFASVPDAIAIVDSRGHCRGANPACERLFGYAQDELLGASLMEAVVPEAGRAEATERLRRVLLGEDIHTEGDRRTKDGALVRVRISVARVKGDPEGRLLLLYNDMTETRRVEAEARAAQARLEMVLASSTAVIYATRVEGDGFIPTWISENLSRITGHQVRDALAPDWWYNHLHPEDRARVLAESTRLLAEDQLTLEYRFQQKDGQMRWMRDQSRLIRDPDGHPREVFGAWLDITDLKLAQEAMREGRDLAERSARARSEFLANMSHEIRTPMNAVLGLTELVLDSDLAPDQRRSLRLVQTAGETLLTLLNDILDLSKIEAEHLSLESIPFDPRYLLESTVSLLSVRAADRPVELIADVASDVPATILSDPTRLRQVLSNLVGNALKFTERGEVVVSASAQAYTETTCTLRFSVRDTGIGIAASKLGTIFEKFTQADASMTRRYGGTGLGLAIARRLVGLMGGELTVTSTFGEGSEFSFVITVGLDAHRAAPVLGTASLTGQRMLVVDDNATNRRIVREMLAMAQVTVEEADSAAAGLEALRQAQGEGRPFRVAIIDAQMPDQDGFELAGHIRADPALATTVRLLMLTSAGERGDTQRCREVGIEAYLMKPVARSDLVEAVSAVLGSSGPASSAEVITRHSIAESRPRMRILLAEDNVVNQQVAATMLRRRGHTVTVVDNGREAVNAVAGGAVFDLVLMDLQMPELDGFAATGEIRSGVVGSKVPILALTAHALTGDRERCMAHGMDGYVTKPFRPHELFAAIEAFGNAAPPVDFAPAAEVPASGPASTIEGPVDLAGFRASMREAGAEEAVDPILELFIEDAPERTAELAAAVAAGDSGAIGRAAHAFKSPAGSIGARGLEALMQEIEQAAKAGEVARAQAAFERVSPEVAAVLAFLNAERGKVTL